MVDQEADPFPTLGAYRRMPAYSFGGKGLQRDDFITKTVNQDGPGPGSSSYEPPAHGFQPDSTKRSAPTYSIGNMLRPDINPCENISPGPGAVNLGGTQLSGPKGFTFKEFKTATRLPMWANNPPPGPGDYELEPAIGKQSSSRYPTLPISKFGTQHRREYRKLWGGNAELTVMLAETPGIKYAVQRKGFREIQDTRKYKVRPWTSFGSMFEPVVRAEADARAEELLGDKKQRMKRMSTVEFIGNQQKVQMNKAVANEIASFPSTKPLPAHMRRRESRRSRAIRWGFKDSGYHRGADDDEMEARVKRWAATAREQHAATMQRIDILDRTRKKKLRK